jgi:hypothetical protein
MTAIAIAAQIAQQMDNPFSPSSKLTAWQIPPLTMMVMMTEIRLTLVSNLRPGKYIIESTISRTTAQRIIREGQFHHRLSWVSNRSLDDAHKLIKYRFYYLNITALCRNCPKI